MSLDAIVCVLRASKEFTSEDVAKLHTRCRKWAPDTPFVALSDVPVECDRIPLKTNWPGWWAKLELFDNFQSALYLDLDTVVQEEFSVILEYEHTFTMLSDFYRPDFPASGVMAWNGDYSYLTDRFRKAPKAVMQHYSAFPKWGDQAFIADSLKNKPERFQALFPDVTGSYKLKQYRSPILCFHGKPKPKDVGF